MAPSKSEKKVSNGRALLVGKIVFVLALWLTASVLGMGSFYYVKSRENAGAKSHFYSTAAEGLKEAREFVQRRHTNGEAMAEYISRVRPDRDDWPLSSVPGFQEITESMLKTSPGSQIGFAPLISSDQTVAFNKFARQFYKEYQPPLPAAIVQYILETNTTKGTLLLDLMESTIPSHFPLLHVSSIPTHYQFIMADMTRSQQLASAISGVYECSKEVKNNTMAHPIQCGRFSETFFRTPQPYVYFIEPVFPSHDTSRTVRLAAISLVVHPDCCS